jgi:putative transposase
MRATRQLELSIRSWGGRRIGAGRKPNRGRRAVAHRRRPTHDPRCPVHVTLRGQQDLPSLRGGRTFGAVRSALAAASHGTFRILHFSVQRDHLHLLVEADRRAGLRSGIQGLAIRLARAINRALGRRGRVWADRHHARSLASPREVRNALVYVLQNWKKHERDARGLDPRSSARWFTGWRMPLAAECGISPVPMARTWLARIGWRRHGLIEMGEAPRTALARS